MKRRLKYCLFILISLTLFMSSAFTPNYTLATSNYEKSTNNNYNVILMIGDGMGYEHIKLARLVEKGVKGNLTMDTFSFSLDVNTKNIENKTTDSAAAATAIATGIKTENGYLGLDENKERLTNILEIAHSLNKATGIISTSSLQHATPAGFVVHVESRYATDEITEQLVNNSKVNLFMGGGKQYFSSDQLSQIEENDYSIIESRNELLGFSSGKLYGLFAEKHLPEEKDRDFSAIPSLAEMTSKALELLSHDEDGFFLMVEGSQIDWGGHDRDKEYVALETIAFDYAVKNALEYVQSHSDTILVVTADHETGGLVVQNSNLNDTLPESMNTENDKRALRMERAEQIEVSWEGNDHTDKLVPFFGYGTIFSELDNGKAIDNTAIFDIMKSYMLNESLSVDYFDIPENGLTEPTNKTPFHSIFWIIPVSILFIVYRKKKNQK